MTMQARIQSMIMAAAVMCALPLLVVPHHLLSVDRTERHHWRDPYVGDWSNGRGDKLIINANTIRFGTEKSVPYHDITRVTNGREFQLEITTDIKLNYLSRFLHVSFGDGDKTDQMKVTFYNSRKDLEAGENSQGEATWQRDR